MRFPSHGHIPPHVTSLSTPSLSLFLPSGLSVREQRLGAPPCHPPTKPPCVSETCWVPGMPGNTLKVGQPQQEQQLLFPGLGPVCDRAGKTVVASEAPTVAVCPHPSTSDYSPRLTMPGEVTHRRTAERPSDLGTWGPAHPSVLSLPRSISG